jgi:hypothetical protein
MSSRKQYYGLLFLLPLFFRVSSVYGAQGDYLSPNKLFTLSVSTDKDERSVVSIISNTDQSTKLLWIGSYGTSDKDQAGLESIDEIAWAPDSKSVSFSTSITRFKGVLQPDSLYVFKIDTGLLAFKRKFGLRWEGIMEWSPVEFLFG